MPEEPDKDTSKQEILDLHLRGKETFLYFNSTENI